MSTVLFLLLKEYTDVEQMSSAPYINGGDCLDESEWLNYYKHLFNTIDFFRYEKCDRFYDVKNFINCKKEILTFL